MGLMGLFRGTKRSPENDKTEGAPDIVVNYSEEDDGIPFNVGDDSPEGRNQTHPQPGCCTRFAKQLRPCQSWFHVKEPCSGRTLDIPESFAPASCYAFLWKLLATAIAILTLAWGLINSNSKPFYFAFLSMWGVCFVNIYFYFSLFNTVFASRTPQPNQTVGMRIRFTWFFGALGTHFTFVATCLYWFLIWKPEDGVQFVRVSEHGGLLLLILVDAIIVNRIPYRMQHYFGVLLVEMLYVVWTVIHGFATDIGNPNRNDNDPETNDDAIYPDVLEWTNDWQKALIYSCGTVFALGPILYLIMWCLSNGVCSDRRKYVDSVDERDQRPTVDDVEEGSVFAKWR